MKGRRTRTAIPKATIATKTLLMAIGMMTEQVERAAIKIAMVLVIGAVVAVRVMMMMMMMVVAALIKPTVIMKLTAPVTVLVGKAGIIITLIEIKLMAKMTRIIRVTLVGDQARIGKRTARTKGMVKMEVISAKTKIPIQRIISLSLIHI